MKKYLIFLTFFSFGLFSNEFLDEKGQQEIDKEQVDEVLDRIYKLKYKEHVFPKINNLIEAKIGYFRPDNERFRNIYSGGAMYSLEGTFQAYKNLYPWAELDYFHKAGKTLNGRSSTRIDLAFIGIGLKYMYPINSHSDSLYLGLGALPSYVHIHDNSQFLIERESKWTIGGIVKGGLLFNFSGRGFFDLFVDYKYLKVSLYTDRGNKLLYFNRINLSGVTIGVGVGFQF